MPLQNTDQPLRWYWAQAIAWIAFDMLDAERHAISRSTFNESVGLEKGEVQTQASRAVSELVGTVADGKLEPIWSEIPELGVYDSADDYFTEWRVQTEETMMKRLQGVVDLSGCPFSGLFFSRSEVLALWPEQPTRSGATQAAESIETKTAVHRSQEPGGSSPNVKDGLGVKEKNEPSPKPKRKGGPKPGKYRSHLRKWLRWVDKEKPPQLDGAPPSTIAAEYRRRAKIDGIEDVPGRSTLNDAIRGDMALIERENREKENR